MATNTLSEDDLFLSTLGRLGLLNPDELFAWLIIDQFQNENGPAVDAQNEYTRYTLLNTMREYKFDPLIDRALYKLQEPYASG